MLNFAQYSAIYNSTGRRNRLHVTAWIIVGIVYLPAAVVGQSAPDRIPVYVQAGDSSSGFTDPSKERNEAAEDIRKKIGQSKVLRLEDADKAAIVIQVLSRGIENRASETRRNDFNRVTVVTARLKVGDYMSELKGDSSHNDGYYGTTRAANAIASQVEKWAVANRAKLAK